MGPSERKTSSDIGAAILERLAEHRNLTPRCTLLSGGVGGARMARGLAAALPGTDLVVVVNVGDDEVVHGLHVSPDLDTVVYTMAGIEGPAGWGRAGDEFSVMDHLAALGGDTRFRLGDADLATNLFRTGRLAEGDTLSAVTAHIAASLGVSAAVLPITDDRLRTKVRTGDGVWRSFQEYFVMRAHQDEVVDLEFEGRSEAKPSPGVLDAIAVADVVVIAPSNPPLSIWPMLAVPGVRDAISAAGRVIAVSPLFGGKALKGPADRVMASLGLPPGNAGVMAAYEGLLTDLVVDRADAGDADLATADIRVHAADTRIAEPSRAGDFAGWLMGLL